MFGISIHAPLRERLVASSSEPKRLRFQSTLPYGSDASPSCTALCSDQAFQSTLPHGGDHVLDFLYDGQGSISIHAPSRERPRTLQNQRSYSSISIHAPLRERQKRHYELARRVNFNPRSLTGATITLIWCPISLFISIHAPSRERHKIPLYCCLLPLFQSTLPRGSDFCALVGFLMMSDFNPRSLAGATLTPIVKLSIGSHFNPRSLAGATW